MRTQEQIANKLQSIIEDDFFGFKTADLIYYLDYEHAKPYLKQEIKEEDWKPFPTDDESVKKEMLDYMPFAWDKANSCRGISAGRSMAHYSVWVWMLGDEDYFGDLEQYCCYGKDNLVKICEKYGWDYKQWDDGVRSNTEY